MNDDRPIQHFPDTYSIKAVGEDKENFAEFVTDVVRNSVTEPASVTHYSRSSRQGKYLSVTISFTAVSQQELDKVFEDVSTQERVVWVL